MTKTQFIDQAYDFEGEVAFSVTALPHSTIQDWALLPSTDLFIILGNKILESFPPRDWLII